MEIYVEQYLQYLQNERKTAFNTVEAYGHDLRKMCHYLNEHGVTGIHQVTFTDLNSYLLTLEKKGCASSTVSRNVSTMKSFFLYLYRQKITYRDPSEKLKAPKIIKKVPEILSVEEMDCLLSCPETDTVKGIRDKAMLELLYATGMKVTEVISLKTEDVNMALKVINLHDEERERIVPFGEPAKKALSNYIENARPVISAGDTDIFFLNMNGKAMSRQGFWKIIKYYGACAGFEERITPHTFRHSFAAHMVENGADLKSLQEMLGHADISTTQIYSGFTNTGVGAAFLKAHPRK